MIKTKENYVVDRNGRRLGVVLDMKQYGRILEDLEELDAIRAYDHAKASHDKAIPFEKAVAEIRRRRK